MALAGPSICHGVNGSLHRQTSMQSHVPERPTVMSCRPLRRSCAGVRAQTPVPMHLHHNVSHQPRLKLERALFAGVVIGHGRQCSAERQGPVSKCSERAQHLLGPTHVLLQQLGLHLAPHTRHRTDASGLNLLTCNWDV